jgi:hypothetical protein
MTTSQVIIFSILAVLAIVGFFGGIFSKSDSGKLLWNFLLFFVAFIFAFLAIEMAVQRETLLEQVQGKCPEYEKIENVYKLKEQ